MIAGHRWPPWDPLAPRGLWLRSGRGVAQAAGGRIALRNLKLSSGPMNGTGAVDVAPGGELSGRLNLVLGSQAVTIAKGSLNVSGSLKDPQLSQ